MSLKAFHMVFIIASGVLALWFGQWSLEMYSESPSSWYVVGAAGSLLAFMGLGIYLVWFLKKLRNVSFLTWAAFFLLIQSSNLVACPVCMGDPNSPLTKSAAAAVWFLLAVVGGVLSSFAGLFLFWMFRAKRLSPAKTN